MRRGTTPTITFNLPFDTEIIKDLRITFAQEVSFFNEQNTVIDKSLSDCTLDGSQIILALTQEDTLKLDSGKGVTFQVKILTTDGQVIASKPRSVAVGLILNGEVL